MINYKKLTAALIAGTIMCFTVTGCTMPWESSSNQTSSSNTTSTSTTSTSTVSYASTGVSSADYQLKLDSEDTITAYDSNNATKITLSSSSAAVTGSGVNINGSNVSITSAGTYILSGNLTEGTININVADKGTVRLIFNGITLSNSTSSPLIIEDASKVIVTLADGTTNTITDSARASTDDETYSGAISSKADIVFNGNGTLNINAGYRNGIKSSDDLIFVSGIYNITSTEDGLIGKDLLGIENGTFTINAGKDGMKSTYDTDTSKGNVIINNGTFNISSGNDAVQSANVLVVNDGTYNIKTGEGAAAATMSSGNDNMMGGRMGMGQPTSSTSSSSTDESMKGLKATNAIYVNSGNITIDSEDDSVHTNNEIYIEGGSFNIKSGDDGIHADSILQIDNGTINVQYCYEGLEAETITINNGDISIVSKDDGINAATGSSSTSAQVATTASATNDKNNAGSQKFQMNGATSSNAQLIINGGNIYVDATGDGLDANGNITINGGYTVVCGPTSNNDTAVDFDGSCTLNGGTLMAFGSSGMLETPSLADNGACIVSAFTSQSANSSVVLTDSAGKEILSYTPTKAYASAILYSSNITTGNTYTLNAGSVSQSITVSNSVTTNGTSTQMGGGANGNMHSGGTKQWGNK